MESESRPRLKCSVETYLGLCTSVIRNVRSRLEAIYGPRLGLSALPTLSFYSPLGTDPSDIAGSVPEPSTMVTLRGLDNANFFDGGNLGNNRGYPSLR
jgi:hypothetical protein